jgi:16S rRNA (cytidine1402-2'-O)-methyltransferase
MMIADGFDASGEPAEQEHGMTPSAPPGTLHVVATPIGNLADLSARAQEVLRAVAAICAEDTRHSRHLLVHYGIDQPLIALHEHNEADMADRLVARILQGESLALISDAGGTRGAHQTEPRIADQRRAAGVRVSPVPGACALVAALSVAGLPSDRFCFEGFLPAKASARRERLQRLAAEPRTLVLYESSHRIVEALLDLAAAFGGNRRGVVARELTKRFETVLDGTLDELVERVRADADQQRGEFVLVVAGAPEAADARLVEGRRIYTTLVGHLPPSKAARLAAELSGAPRKTLYGGD